MWQLNNKKKVLIISYFFPPLGGSGVQRTAKFVKYLPQFNWKPYVLTVKPVEYIAFDKKLLKEIEFTPVYRTESLDPMRILYFIEKFRKSKNRIYHTADSKIKKISREIFPIDSKIGWLPFAFFTGIKICKEKKINKIYATLSPYSSAILAYLISKVTNIPYILDYRDLWKGKPDISYLTKCHEKISEIWERKVLQHAEKVIINTNMALKKIQKIYPEIPKSKFEVIYNGFDEDDFKLNVSKKKNKKIIFTYTGGFYGERTPKYFLNSLLKIKDFLKGKVEFRFIGNYHTDIMKMFKDFPNLIKVIPQVTHDKSISYLYESDFLMLFIAKKNSEIVIPAKLFEYMAVKKPILAMVPTKGEAAQLIEKYNLGKVCEPDNEEKIKSYIFDFIHNKVKVEMNHDLKIFTRKYQTELLVKILEQK